SPGRRPCQARRGSYRPRRDCRAARSGRIADDKLTEPGAWGEAGPEAEPNALPAGDSDLTLAGPSDGGLDKLPAFVDDGGEEGAGMPCARPRESTGVRGGQESARQTAV